MIKHTTIASFEYLPIFLQLSLFKSSKPISLKKSSTHSDCPAELA